MSEKKIVEVGTEIDLRTWVLKVEGIGDGRVYYKKPNGKMVNRKIPDFNQAVKHLGYAPVEDKAKNKPKRGV